MSRVVGIRTFDIWAHEQDVRRAVGRPQRLDCPAASVAVDRIATALPILLSREAQAPPGTVLRWVIGPPTEQTVTVVVRPDRRGELVRDRDHADVVVGCDTEALTLLACGRRSRSELDIDVTGDRQLGERVLAAMPITP